jgi:hypothetical protein
MGPGTGHGHHKKDAHHERRSHLLLAAAKHCALNGASSGHLNLELTCIQYSISL